MIEKEQYNKCFEKLLGYISSTLFHGILSEEATNIQFLTGLIGKTEFTKGEENLLSHLFTANELSYSKDPLAIVQLALAIIEVDTSPYSENRNLNNDVNHISISSGINLKIIEGEKPSVKIVANNKRSAARIVTRYSGETLFIERDPIVNTSQNGAVKQIIHGNVGQVAGRSIINNGFNMTVSMSGDVIVNGQSLSINSDSEYVEITASQIASVSVQGSSDVEYLGVSLKDLLVTINGSGDVLLHGRVHNFIARVNGSGGIHAKELMTSTAEMTLNGSGSIKANVSNDARASLTGSGTIKVIGNPTNKSQSCTGSGKIKFN